jgi:hypothetical protein
MDRCRLYLALRHSLRLFVSAHCASSIRNTTDIEQMGPGRLDHHLGGLPPRLARKGCFTRWFFQLAQQCKNKSQTKPQQERMLTKEPVRRRHVDLRLH